MRRMVSRRKTGGKALASGADGCVFDVRFGKDGTTQDIPGIVSKVFPKEKKAVADNEFSILALVNKTIPDGKGIVSGNVELRTITDVKDEMRDKSTFQPPNACGMIVKQKERGETPFYVLEYPRVDGSLLQHRGKLPLDAFNEAIIALQTLSANGLIHMDIAPRNVFVKDNTCLIGDFGNMININDEGHLDSVIKEYLSKNMINSIRDCLTDGDTTSSARIAMLLYVSDDITPFREEMIGYLTGSNDSHDYSEAQRLPILMQHMGAYLNMMVNIETKDAIKSVMLQELKQSDIRMLALVIIDRATPPDSAKIKALELWGIPIMRGSKRTRRKRVKISRKHKYGGIGIRR